MAEPLNERFTDYTEGVSHLAIVVAETIAASGIEQEKAEALTREAIERYRREFGGHTLYVPKMTAEETAAKHKEIYQAWRRNVPIETIAFNHDLSTPHVYEIIRQQKKRPENRMKGLFPDGTLPEA